MESQRILRFGDFDVDLRSGELRRNGVKIKIQDQPFQILASLLERPGDLVTREELRKRLWPEGIHVDFENGLNIAVTKLRQTLGDEAETPRFIETLPKRGYRFIASVKRVEPQTRAAAVPHPEGWPAEAPPRRTVAGMDVRPVGALLAMVGVAVAVITIRGWLMGSEEHPIHSLAVLPLQNMSGDPAQDYFADGITEELITDLAAIRSLRIISRTSSMLYKGARKPVREIGRELGTDAIIEGAVVRSGGRVRITAQLIDATTDRHMWAASYEEDIRDVLSVQDRVAREIADTVRTQLTPQERQRLRRSQPVNPKAYEAVLKGRYYAYKLSEDALRKGEAYFRDAIGLDPRYAPPYAGLAYVWLARAGWTDSPEDAIPKAKRAAETALGLDPTLAEAHADLGLIHFWYDWDWPSAEREFRRALALNPGNALAHEAYGQTLAWMGRADESIAEGKKAVSLDPVSIEAMRILGEDYYFSRRYPAAVAAAREAVNMDPNYWFAHVSLGRAYLRSGKNKEAIAELETASRLQPDNPDGQSSLGNAFGVAGMRSQARAVLGKLQTLSKTRYVAPYQLAVIYAGLGDKDRSLELLEQDRHEHSMFVTWLKTDPALDDLRSDPRFDSLSHSSPGSKNQHGALRNR